MFSRGLELVKVYWQTLVVALGPLLLSPILFIPTDTLKVGRHLFINMSCFLLFIVSYLEHTNTNLIPEFSILVTV